MRIDKIMFKNENGQLNFIDLFAGAGGLSEGFFQAGFNPIAHVEMNKSASKTLETRSAYYYLKKNNELDLYYQYERGQITRDELFSHIPDDVIKTVINAEMSPDTLPGIFEQIDTILKEDKVSDVDVIIGGPPCQAYSLVGRAQSSHMLTPMEEDPRNELYKMYTRFLTKYQPKMFVFENVAGLLTARGGDAFKNLTAHLKRVGYEIDFKEQNAADFGVLQKRKRIIIIGWRKGTDHFYPEFEKIRSNAIVNDLLDDLAPVERGQENDAYRLTYDQCSAYLKENNIRTEEDVVTHHIARPNNDMLERVIEPKEHGFPCDYTNMFLLQHSEYIPELLIESEEKYRFYAELKRSVKHAEINKDADNIGFEYRDVHFIFTDGNILAIKEGRIVEKRAISDFARRPADTYRRLRMAITYPDMDV